MARAFDPFNEAVAGIYEGAFDEARWTESMRLINAMFDLSFSMVGVEDIHKGRVLKSEFYGAGTSRFAEGVAEYQQARHLVDPTVRFVSANPHRGLMDSAIDFDADDPGVRDYLAWNRHALGSERWLLCYQTTPEGLAVGYSAHFATAERAFAKASRKDLVTLFGHMARAQKLAARPAMQPAEGGAVVVVDGAARLLHASPAAEQLIRAGVLVVEGGHLTLADRATGDRLLAIIRDAAVLWTSGCGTDELTLGGHDGRPGCRLSVSPVLRPASPLAPLAPAVEVRINPHPTAQAERPEELWRRRFGFTPAEARLATQMLTTEGRLRDVAEALGISYATARVHLARMFGKAEVRSQAQLVRLLASADAARPGDPGIGY